ncbi:DUF3325 domain-containing protein [Methylorubrum suomiense]
MTPTILLLNLSLCFAALTALCLSLNRHHTEVFQSKPSARRILLLRVLGWTGIGLSLTVAGVAEGWNFGPVQWIGTLTGAAVALVLLLSYRPRLIGQACGAAIALAVAVSAMLQFA